MGGDSASKSDFLGDLDVDHFDCSLSVRVHLDLSHIVSLSSSIVFAWVKSPLHVFRMYAGLTKSFRLL